MHGIALSSAIMTLCISYSPDVNKVSQCRNVLVQETELGRQLVRIARKEFTLGMRRRTTDSSPQTQHISHHISYNMHPTTYP